VLVAKMHCCGHRGLRPVPLMFRMAPAQGLRPAMQKTVSGGRSKAASSNVAGQLWT
jgi:hypothetical protein